MRISAFLGQALAVVAAGSIFGGNEHSTLGSQDPMLPLIKTRRRQSRGGKAPMSYRTGETYPHSSTRQQRRYARQIAAGQIKLITA